MEYQATTRGLLAAAYSDVVIDYPAGYSMSRDLESVRMSGQFLIVPSQSYLHVQSELFNAVSAAILFNQVALAMLLETDDITAKEGVPGLGRLLLRSVRADCKRMITPDSATDFTFECSMKPLRARRRYTARMLLSDGAFALEGAGVLTEADHHNLAAANRL